MRSIRVGVGLETGRGVAGEKYIACVTKDCKFNYEGYLSLTPTKFIP